MGARDLTRCTLHRQRGAHPVPPTPPPSSLADCFGAKWRPHLLALAQRWGAYGDLAEDAFQDAAAQWSTTPWSFEAFSTTVREAAQCVAISMSEPRVRLPRPAGLYLRRRVAPLPAAVSPVAAPLPRLPLPPASDLLLGSLHPRNRVENARAALVVACDEAIEALAVPSCDGPASIAHWLKALPRPAFASDRVYWALTNAGRWQRLHGATANEERPRAARAYAATPYASLIFEALLDARRRRRPSTHVPRLLAHRLGYVPGRATPLAWALLEIEAGMCPPGGPSWERKRADAWKKRLARTCRQLEAEAPRATAETTEPLPLAA
jgi:hypothetical protein